MIKKAEIIKNGNVNLNQDNDIQRLYEWLISEPRPKAQTFFTSGEIRNVAKEIEWKSHQQYMIKEAKYNRVLGEFIGTLKGVCYWEIPNELKLKLERKIKELEKE